jgi:hypothetical protein
MTGKKFNITAMEIFQKLAVVGIFTTGINLIQPEEGK